MVAVATKARLVVAQTFEVAFGASAALLLQRSSEVKQPPLDRLPRLLAQEPIVAGNGRAGQAQVHADNLFGGRDLHFGHGDDHVQPPAVLALDQISGIDRTEGVALGIGGQSKADGQTLVDRAHLHRAVVPIDAEGMQVVARRAGGRVRLTDLAADLLAPVLPAKIQRALDRFSRHPEGARRAPGHAGH